MDITRPTIMEVNLTNFKYNIAKIQEKVGNDVTLMPVIKANGYGTYINKELSILNMFKIVAVATVDEGVFIRSIGYEKEIFVLNQAFETEIDKIIKYNLTVGISSYNFAEKLAENGKDVNVHVEIGTGMGRRGYGYGCGVQILLHPELIGSTAPVGLFGWDGAAGSCIIMDTASQTSLVYTMHIRGYGPAYGIIHPTLRDMVFGKD